MTNTISGLVFVVLLLVGAALALAVNKARELRQCLVEAQNDLGGEG